MSDPELAALFDKAREADIEAVAGVKLYRAGGRLRGECPLCGASKGKHSGGAFSADPGERVFKCFACGAGGDVIELEFLLNSHPSRRAAAELLAGAAPAAASHRARETKPAPVAEPSTNVEAAARVWRNAGPARGSPVEAYLRGRGLSGWVLGAMVGGLRYHPNTYWGEDERGQRIWLPAMVGQVVTPEGPTCGLHLTFLDPVRGRKTPRSPAKRMLGPMTLNGRPGGVWLHGPAGVGPLVEGEGIESTASAAQLLDRPCRMLAALSLGALQGGWLADKWGRIDPECVTADPERPALTWPEPVNHPWVEVCVAVDRDMAPIRVRARRAAGGTYQRLIDGEARARICAGLAEQAWRRAGALAVRAIAPGPGRDFNDELRARRAMNEGVA